MSIASEIEAQRKLAATLTELVNEHGFIHVVDALAVVTREIGRKERNTALVQLANKLEELT